MNIRPVEHYSALSKVFHWLIALFVIAMLIGGFFLDDVPEQYKGTVFMLHKSTGITILFLMILRLILIHFTKKPALPTSMKLWEKIVSRLVQYGFYLLLLIMPLSGWIMSVAGNRIPIYFGMFQAPLPWIEVNKYLSKVMNKSHEVIAWILIAFITIHILGALKHHFIDKDTILRSMLPGKNS
jgi:cytochrome b561